MNDESIKLAMRVAALLSQDAATDKDFILEVVYLMNEKGYTIHAHQRGISGTYLTIDKLRE